MAEIINLRQARKQAKRADAARAAEVNRVAFGRTKGERTLSEKEKALAERKLEGHLLRAAAPPAKDGDA